MTTPMLADPAALPECLPAEVRERVAADLEAFAGAAREHGVALSLPPDLAATLPRVWAFSRFVAQSCIRHPQQFAELLSGGDLQRARADADYVALVQAATGAATTVEELGQALRALRRREMVRIAWRDLAGLADLDETLAELSALACAILDQALGRLHQWHCDEWGRPLGRQSGREQHLVVLGMGKLGAGELNFSSDIDLIFAYPEDGATAGGRAALSNEEYFVRLGRALVNVLDKADEHGRVYRVDMRLRPFGGSGPLAMSFDGLESYYQAHGRQWERYAMIKARVVAGDAASGDALMKILRPFVYRRYLDFSSFDELRAMKQRIESEVRRKGMERNIKLGAGGIREVEFIGQAFQLIRGGREPELQERPIQPVLKRLGAGGYLPQRAVDELIAAYRFLRRVENRLQEYNDEQTHTLPVLSAERQRLAVATGFAACAEFDAELALHMRRVHGHFEQLIAIPQADAGAADAAPLAAVWLGRLDADKAQAALAAAGYDDGAAALNMLTQLRSGSAFRALTPQGHARLDQLMPLLLAATAGTARPAAALQRLVHLVEKIARRTTYLSLLVEHPMALSQLVQLAAASPWISQLLLRSPILLDELLDPRTLYAPLDRHALEAELVQMLGRLPQDDLEAQMEALRLFKQTNVLRVAAADVAGVYPLMVVSDHLTEIATVALGQVLRLAWGHVAAKVGQPRLTVDGRQRAAGFIVVGYGKLGGIELGYGSDLDLVFIHDDAGDDQHTDGARPVDNATFFVRLGQRIIHIMNTATAAGVLYELDMRLRPSGASGLLVTGINGFVNYQRQQAWTWEHQALVRARVVAGDETLARRFDAIRDEVLAAPRDVDKLRAEVIDMRARMAAALGRGDAVQFDLKQDDGGIADIEFMVQFGVLRYAGQYPALRRWTDNIRLLETLSAIGVMAPADAACLADAYRAYRAEVHRRTLQELPAVVDAGAFAAERAQVRRIWQGFLGRD